jgi:hypothetical protein
MMITLRLGMKFRQQHSGRRPGFLHHYIADLVARIESPATFKQLIDEIETAAARRNLAALGEALPPIETVNHVWGLVTYHHPRRGRLQVTFGTLRNYLTVAKKEQFLRSGKP